jgi:cation:H+ antiporter
MGAFDLAIGNVYGSNAFNMILFAPLDVIYRDPATHGSLLAAVSPRHTITCVVVLLAMQVAIMGQLFHAESRRRFIEPDAWLVILIVVGGLAFIYYLP